MKIMATVSLECLLNASKCQVLETQPSRGVMVWVEVRSEFTDWLGSGEH